MTKRPYGALPLSCFNLKFWIHRDVCTLLVDRYLDAFDYDIIKIASHLELDEAIACNNYYCAHYGYLRLLQWRHTSCNTSLTRSAAENGHLHVLKWLHLQRVQIYWMAWEESIHYGHLEVFKWLCSLNKRPMSVFIETAIMRNQLPILKWMVENGGILSPGDFYIAMKNPTYDILDYMVEQKFPLHFESWCKSRDEQELVRWLRSPGPIE